MKQRKFDSLIAVKVVDFEAERARRIVEGLVRLSMAAERARAKARTEALDRPPTPHYNADTHGVSIHTRMGAVADGEAEAGQPGH